MAPISTDSKLAAVAYGNGFKRVYFQNNDGNICEACFNPGDGATWFGGDLPKRYKFAAKQGTPISSVVWKYNNGNIKSIYVLYANAQGILSVARTIPDGWEEAPRPNGDEGIELLGKNGWKPMAAYIYGGQDEKTLRVAVAVMDKTSIEVWRYETTTAQAVWKLDSRQIPLEGKGPAPNSGFAAFAFAYNNGQTTDLKERITYVDNSGALHLVSLDTANGDWDDRTQRFQYQYDTLPPPEPEKVPPPYRLTSWGPSLAAVAWRSVKAAKGAPEVYQVRQFATRAWNLIDGVTAADKQVAFEAIERQDAVLNLVQPPYVVPGITNVDQVYACNPNSSAIASSISFGTEELGTFPMQSIQVYFRLNTTGAPIGEATFDGVNKYSKSFDWRFTQLVPSDL